MKETSRLSKKVSKKNLQRISRMYSKEKGITLIALVITIVILIILATVTLNVVLGEGGLIQRAQQAKDLTEQAALEEQQGLNSLMSEYANIMAEDQNPPEPEMPTINDAKPNPNEDGPKFEDTTPITDDLDNEVTIPGGFHLDKDSGTKVEEGIVIEDDSGNQFVWIPVGEYNVTKKVEEITEPDIQDGKLTNELSRRTFTENGSTLVNGDDAITGAFPKFNEYYYGEGDNNSIANGTIDAFKTSSTTNKGFYIGRYEAGTETERTASTDPLTRPLVQANRYPYAYVTRDQAKTQAEAMYSENEFVTSQLISSYAWDTALNFICQTNTEGYLLAMTTDSIYGNINTGYEISNRTQTGEYASDDYSKIHDILGNCVEWTTEYSTYTGDFGNIPWVNRGGSHSNNDLFSASRNNYRYYTMDYSRSDISFRIQLYINPEN